MGIYNEVALKCQKPSPILTQMSMCAYTDATPHIALQEAVLTKKILATTV